MQILVIGYGNPLRQDDGVGWHVIEHLNETVGAQDSSGLTVLFTHQLTPDLAETISQVERVLFIDATNQDGVAGFSLIPVDPVETAPASFSHHVTPGVLLTLAEGLYGRRPQGTALIVNGQAFGYGESLSPEVAALVPAIVGAVREWCK